MNPIDDLSKMMREHFPKRPPQKCKWCGFSLVGERLIAPDLHYRCAEEYYGLSEDELNEDFPDREEEE